jgi:hypothetical protein
MLGDEEIVVRRWRRHQSYEDMRPKEGESNEREDGEDENLYFLVYKKGVTKDLAQEIRRLSCHVLSRLL